MPRAVAFLDILVFKNLLDTLPLLAIAQKYESAIDQLHGMNRRWDGNPEE